MTTLGDAYQFAEMARRATSLDQLTPLVEDISRDMGFRHFAMGHHFDFKAGSAGAIVVHNYPSVWAEYFTDHKLHENDPVVRASERMNVGFRWSTVPKLVNFTSEDRDILDAARQQGISDGFTMPFHMPGDLPGSVSFATPVKGEMRDETLLFAQLVGSLAFEAARRISRQSIAEERIKLTERQRECLILAAKGKTDAQIAKILGISEETSTLHLKMARDRYGVAKRLPLAIRALYDGQISFWEVLD